MTESTWGSLRCIATLALVFHLSAPAASASDTPSIHLTDLSLEELASLKVETVVGASRYEQKTSDAPSSVSIVTQDDIQKFGYRTLADILNGVRGFYVTYDRGYSYIGVRGFNRPGDFGGRILLMVDGHRLNDGIYDTAASGNDFPLDVDLIERVEVIRGSGSSLYGNNAFFAVINVITRRGKDLNGTELSGSYGSFDTWTGRASYGQRLTNGVELLISGSVYDSAGQERLRFPEFVARQLDGSFANNAFARVSYSDFTLQGGFMQREKDWPTAAYGTVPDSHDLRFETIDTRAWADLTFHRELPGQWLFTARGYADRYQYDAHYPYDYDDDPSTRPTLNRDFARVMSAGLDLSMNRTWLDTHHVTLGAEYRHDLELQQQNWDSTPRLQYVDSDESAYLLGAYVQDEWSIRTNLILNAGARYDHYSAFGGTANPRAALIYRPWESSTFKFLYGQAFRAPNAYEMFYAGPGSRANPNLQPETIRSYELVWEQRLAKRWRSSMSLFWADVDDLIDQKLDPGPDPVSTDDDTYFFDNSGSALSRGGGVELEGKLDCGLSLRVNYSFTDAIDERTGQQLDNSPRHLGKLNLSQALWREKIFASLEMQAMSSRGTVGGKETSAFAIFNFTLYSRELVKGLDVSASIYNLFDEQYSHPVSADFFYTGPISGDTIHLDSVAQDGRTFRVKLTYRF